MAPRWAKASPLVKILKTNKVDKGKDKANTLIAKVLSKVFFFLAVLSSSKPTAEMWAKGQKLQALKPNESSSRMSLVVVIPENIRKTPLRKATNPALTNSKDSIVVNCFLFMFTARPIKRSTKGVMIPLSLFSASLTKIGNESIEIPESTKIKATIMKIFTGSDIIANANDFNFEAPFFSKCACLR